MESAQTLPSDSELLEQINTALDRLGEIARYKRLPEVPAICAALHRRMLVMVDDSPCVLAAYVPHLVATTRGKAAFVLHEEQDIAELVEETLAHTPDTVLMDYFLAGDLRGDEVARFLHERTNRAVPCIGFSSMSSAARYFARVGSLAVTKSPSDPSTSLAEIAQIVAGYGKSM
ncbi:hypothetical protein HYS30_02470 [Candidatus Peregrinibacteria bacterium]|nr:hypothetical protein [Candidatus Peregrinibacteria bacterium]MBI2636309.1 hypothetical protein [Candidatus Peregrinibacteria bacterium]